MASFVDLLNIYPSWAARFASATHSDCTKFPGCCFSSFVTLASRSFSQKAAPTTTAKMPNVALAKPMYSLSLATFDILPPVFCSNLESLTQPIPCCSKV